MEEPADPPRRAHKKTAPSVAAVASATTTSESLRARQLDRLATRSNSLKPPTPAKRKSNGRDDTSDSASTTGPEIAKAKKAVTSRKTPHASKLPPKIHRDGLLSSSAAQRLNNRTLGNGENGTMHSRGNGSSGENKLMDETLASGKEGRSFTVGKVGGGGKIYLTPSIRPAHHLYQQPNFQFPTRPTTKNGSGALLADHGDEDNQRDSIWTSPSRSATPLREFTSNLKPSQHLRAWSHSTIDEHAVQDWDVGAFRVVIDRPSADGRPKTSGGTSNGFTLEVPIPSYKIGTPRFSVKGTPFIRGSSYAPTEADNRTSIMTRSQRESSFLGRSDSRSFHPASSYQNRYSIASSRQGDQASVFELRLPPTGLTGQAPNLMPRQAIVPEMFDSISTFPMCEDRSVVRRNLAGQINAATPARLIVEVTKELNYELVASIFITYRSYVAASDLLSLVMARLQHGINQGDKGLVVTVRCFTVVRHWLVNFFIDDFVLDYSLRVEFCEQVNNMVKKQAVQMTNSKTTNDILSNIKRLWRDSCSTYWDGPEFEVDSGPLVPIYPGGVAGSRDPRLTPEMFAEILQSKGFVPEHGDMSVLSRPPMLELDLDNSVDTSTQRFFSSVPMERSTEPGRNTSNGSSTSRGHRPGPSSSERPMSPQSIASVEAFSCSFPLKAGNLTSATRAGAHPVPVSSIAESSPIGRAFKPMRSNSQRGPRRNRSVSNSSRPERPWSADTDNQSAADNELQFTYRFAGSLIRGLVFLPPTDVYLPVDEAPISRPASLPNKNEASTKHEVSRSSGGMKKMFGTVRRAGKKSEGGDRSPHVSFPHLSVALEQTAAIGCAAGVSVVKHCFPGRGRSMALRPDKLSQFVERDFEAIVEQHKAELDEAEKEGNDDAQSYRRGESEALGLTGDSPSAPLPSPPFSSKSRDEGRPPKLESFPAFEDNARSASNAEMLPSSFPPLPGSALVEASWPLPVVPTPPVTPPERLEGNVQNLREYGANADRTPSLVLGLRSPASDLDSQLSFKPLKHPSTRRRERKDSHAASLRRIASFNSGYTRQTTEQSFDATTFSDVAGRASVDSTHAPGHRVLRRRPGGDLRAVNRVNDLPIRRYRSSTGSLSMYDPSLSSSFMPASTESAEYLNVAGPAQNDLSRPFSVAALADPDGTSKPQAMSLFSTDSKPIMRASFQAEAAKLADIPDDVNDDGGVESALLKLEGKFDQRKSQTSSPGFDTADFTTSSEAEFERMFEHTSTDDSTETERHMPALNHAKHTLSRHSNETSQPRIYEDETTPTAEAKPSLSLQSYNDIPLLQRDSEFSRYQSHSHGRPRSSALEAPSSSVAQSQRSYSPSHESLNIVNRTDSINNIAPGETLPRHFSAKGSYVEIMYDHDHSDLSSEMSMDMISSQDFSTSAFLNKPSPYQQGKRNTELQIPPSKTSQESGLTMQQALGLLPSRDTFPPTAQGTPTIQPACNRSRMRSWNSGNQAETAEGSRADEHIHADGSQIIDEHYPFILSFPPLVLAQQFTLVEMEALTEIHFRELLEMKWSGDAAASTRSWPKFLQKLSKLEEDDSVSHGIEICAARSSIMTSWAISQVVLTKDLGERAKTVGQLIRIAGECRGLGNYATVFQLTVALTNPVLTELHQTWQLVPAADIAILRDLEALIQPANNFRRLRDEMESVLGKGPCIPLVAIYAKDLSALKEGPSYIASSVSEPPLINVTKCRAQAAVVQLVARYLERCGELRITPVPDVAARCLWVGGLRDAEVRECTTGLV